MKHKMLIMAVVAMWLLSFGTCSAVSSELPMELKVHPWYQKKNFNGSITWVVSTDPIIAVDHDMTPDECYLKAYEIARNNGSTESEARRFAREKAIEREIQFSSNPSQFNKSTVQFWLGYVGNDQHTYFIKVSVDMQEFKYRNIKTYNFEPKTNKLVDVVEFKGEWNDLAKFPYIQEALAYLMENRFGVFKDMEQ